MADTPEVAERKKPGPKPKNPKLLRVPIFGRVERKTKEFLERLPGADNVGRAIDIVVELHRQALRPVNSRNGR